MILNSDISSDTIIFDLTLRSGPSWCNFYDDVMKYDDDMTMCHKVLVLGLSDGFR